MIKKIMTLVLTALIGLSGAACGDGGNTGADIPDQKPDQKSDGKILIAYYSRTGNTKELAEMIQGETSGDLFEIKTEAAYPDSYDEMLDIATKEQSENARPALSSAVENMKDYDVIFIGYPIWWGDTPMAVRTFLESYDFSGKKVVPFCTYGSSGFGNSLKSVKASAAKAEVLDGFGTAGSQVGGKQAELGEWIKGLKI